jgi:hypothetical protein
LFQLFHSRRSKLSNKISCSDANFIIVNFGVLALKSQKRAESIEEDR